MLVQHILSQETIVICFWLEETTANVSRGQIDFQLVVILALAHKAIINPFSVGVRKTKVFCGGRSRSQCQRQSITFARGNNKFGGQKIIALIRYSICPNYERS